MATNSDRVAKIGFSVETAHGESIVAHRTIEAAIDWARDFVASPFRVLRRRDGAPMTQWLQVVERSNVAQMMGAA